MEAGVRYQFYATTDGYILFMASEREFWKNFCEGVGRTDLFERWPGAQYGDHARGNTELRAILREIFASRSSAEWLEFGMKHNTPIAPSNTPKTIGDDPQFRDRMPWIPASSVGADMLPTPIKFVGETLPEPTMAPDRRRAHRAGAARRARLGRRPDRRRPRRRRVRQGSRTSTD